MKRRLQPASNPPALKVAAVPELGPKRERGPMMHELYRRAAAQLRKERKAQLPASAATPLVGDPLRLLHEMQVHQVELQMQNAELQEGRDRMEVQLEKYSELYDFAPVGYFTLGADGTIHLANLTGARLIGIDRSVLLGRSFVRNVAPEFRPAFNEFLSQVFGSQTKQSGDFELGGPDRPFRYVADEGFKYDVQCRIPDVSKARDRLGFEANTTLDAILDEVIPWITEQVKAGVI